MTSLTQVCFTQRNSVGQIKNDDMSANAVAKLSQLNSGDI